MNVAVLVVTACEVATFVLNDVANVLAEVFVHTLAVVHVLARQAADFEEDRSFVFVLKPKKLGVGGIAIVVIADATADRYDFFGQMRIAQSPAADVELVWALVAEVAIAISGLPMPIVVQFLAHDRIFIARSIPEIHLNGIGVMERFISFANRRARLVAETACDFELAEFPLLEPFKCLRP